ncbi:MAG: enoyl-CoA hydratase [Chloroflexota bacterium]|nr:enoyl-CoA hydratase [Chloroflexota bacterium]
MTDALAATAPLRVEFPAPSRVGRSASADDPGAHVALLTLDRPAQLNALNDALLRQLAAALERLDADPECRCMVITGAGERAFAAGADIKELIDQTPGSLAAGGSFDAWDRIRRVRKPIIAAVRGYALGGGCELAMACDMIVAGDDAQFGQPEIKIGVIPGAGGTQRLTRAIGKARAMELILTGRSIDAREADALGLVTSVVPAEATVAAAMALAGRIAAMPPLAVVAAKEAVRAAFEGSLTAGLESERRLFFGLFGTEDQREGMAAFVEKRTPRWSGR